MRWIVTAMGPTRAGAPAACGFITRDGARVWTWARRLAASYREVMVTTPDGQAVNMARGQEVEA